jgi:Ran GTPase-activating protein (RanGAP) involved in mRNA processing and transport
MPIASDILARIRSNKDAEPVLSLYSAKIGDDGAIALAAALKVNHTIETLNLSWNVIGDEGAIALADALNRTRIRKLNFHTNNIGDKGAIALAEALKANHALTDLNLSFNLIGVSGVLALADALKVNHMLTRLNLSGNSIGDEGTTVIAKMLETSRTLTRLELDGIGMGSEAWQALADALRTNHRLAELSLNNNNATQKDMQTLAKAVMESDNKNIIYAQPATEALKDYCRANRNAALSLIQKLQESRENLTAEDIQNFEERMPAIAAAAKRELEMPEKDIGEMFAYVQQAATLLNLNPNPKVSSAAAHKITGTSITPSNP